MVATQRPIETLFGRFYMAQKALFVDTLPGFLMLRS
jgi:hypothetical protein